MLCTVNGILAEVNTRRNNGQFTIKVAKESMNLDLFLDNTATLVIGDDYTTVCDIETVSTLSHCYLMYMQMVEV